MFFKKIFKTIFVFGLILGFLASQIPVEGMMMVWPDPVVIVPGIGASWNWDVMFNRVLKDEWDFFPGVRNYDGLVKSLEMTGFKKGKNLFICFYDWRKSNQISAREYLKPIIDQAKKNSVSGKVDLIAHSMGGLVARSYIQSDDYQGDIDQLFLLGVPNKGSSDVYVIWESGLIPRNWSIVKQAIFNPYLWYLTGLHQEKSRYDLVHNYIPSLGELMPIYDFLIDKQTDQLISVDQMKEKNDFLLDLDKNKDLLLERVREVISLAGKDYSTINSIPVTKTDQEPLWLDGKPDPYPPEFNDLSGDQEVLLKSASLFGTSQTEDNSEDNRGIVLSIDHEGLVSDQQVIENIFSRLALKLPEKIPAVPIWKRVLSFLFASPVEIKIISPDGKEISRELNETQDSDLCLNKQTQCAEFSGESDPKGKKIVSIFNPLEGEYKIELNGLADGEYQMAVVLFDEQGEAIREDQAEVKKDESIEYKVKLAESVNSEIPDEKLKLEKQEEINPGEIIINELMWSGSSVSWADEWIELKNTTSREIDLAGFNLTQLKDKKEESMLLIDSGKIAPQGFFLIANNSKDHQFTNGKSILNIDPDLVDSKLSLSNSELQIKLYDRDFRDKQAILLDTAGSGKKPLAGKNDEDKKASMERNEKIEDGILESSWHSSLASLNFDQGVADQGTPREKNSKIQIIDKDENAQKDQDNQDSQNSQNDQNTQNIQNAQNTQNAQNVQSSQSAQSSQNNQSDQNTQNTQNAQNNQSNQNNQNTQNNQNNQVSQSNQASQNKEEDFQEVDLKNIRSLSKGTEVKTKGIVSVPPGILGEQIFYLSGSGVQVYLYDKNFPHLELGDYIQIKGEISEAQQETRIKLKTKQDILILEKRSPPISKQAKTGEINESLEGSLIRISGQVTETEGEVFYLDDGSGRIKIYIKDSTKIKKPKMKKEDQYEITGIVSRTKTDYRILPRFQSDIVENEKVKILLRKSKRKNEKVKEETDEKAKTKDEKRIINSKTQASNIEQDSKPQILNSEQKNGIFEDSLKAGRIKEISKTNKPIEFISFDSPSFVQEERTILGGNIFALSLLFGRIIWQLLIKRK